MSSDQPNLQSDEERAALQRLARHRAKPVGPSGQILGRRVQQVLGKVAKDEGPGLPMIQSRWRDLVGERLSKMSRPVKLTGKSTARILTLEILPASAPVFQHMSEQLKQKLGALMGGHFKEIKYLQTTPTRARPAARPLSAQEREEIMASLADIKNPQLSAALLAFGEAVYTQDR